MKLATFNWMGETQLGAVRGDGLIALGALGDIGRHMGALLAAGPGGLQRVRTFLERSNPLIPLSNVRLEAPVPRPGKILAIGMNYLDHIKEMGREPPPAQVWFNKQWNAISGPHDPIIIPAAAPDMVDFEGELCVVIGRRCRHVPAERAFEVVAGFMVGNDVTARDWQSRSPTMTMGKSFASHAPTGPWLTTADEVENPQALALKTFVNGQLVQDHTTGGMVYKIADQIAHLTAAFPLDPGDILFTGTPAGVGAGRKPPLFLKAGDKVRVEIEGLGAIENVCAAEEKRTIIA